MQETTLSKDDERITKIDITANQPNDSFGFAVSDDESARSPAATKGSYTARSRKTGQSLQRQTLQCQMHFCPSFARFTPDAT